MVGTLRKAYGIDLTQHQRHWWPALEIATEEAIGEHAKIDRRACGIRDHGRPAWLREREHAEDAPDAAGVLVVVNVIADGADRRARVLSRVQERQHLRGRAARTIGVVDAVLAPRSPHVLAQQLAGRRIERPDIQVVRLTCTRRPIQPGGAL